MPNPYVQRLIAKYSGEGLNRKGGALRCEIRKAPVENQEAAWTVYAVLLAAERCKPSDPATPAYAAWREAHDAVMDVLGHLLWPDGLDPTAMFTSHLTPERRREAFRRYRAREQEEKTTARSHMTATESE